MAIVWGASGFASVQQVRTDRNGIALTGSSHVAQHSLAHLPLAYFSVAAESDSAVDALDPHQFGHVPVQIAIAKATASSFASALADTFLLERTGSQQRGPPGR